MIKKLLRPLIRWLRSKRYVVASLEARTYGKMAIRDRYADIKTRLATESPIIHSFEPIPELVGMLRQKFMGRNKLGWKTL
ncbi:MAG: hypothetical protein QNK15_11915 [Cycloclasticus sp.]|nr:hypothetical protein [Cycloclasticus sp.]